MIPLTLRSPSAGEANEKLTGPACSGVWAGRQNAWPSSATSRSVILDDRFRVVEDDGPIGLQYVNAPAADAAARHPPSEALRWCFGPSCVFHRALSVEARRRLGATSTRLLFRRPGTSQLKPSRGLRAVPAADFQRRVVSASSRDMGCSWTQGPSKAIRSFEGVAIGRRAWNRDRADVVSCPRHHSHSVARRPRDLAVIESGEVS